MIDAGYPGTSLAISSLEPLTVYTVSVVVNNDALPYVGSSTAVEHTIDTLSNGIIIRCSVSLGTRPFALRGMVWFHCNIAFLDIKYITYLTSCNVIMTFVYISASILLCDVYKGHYDVTRS